MRALIEAVLMRQLFGTAEFAAGAHLDAGLSCAASGEYAGDYWLATFAMLALA
ncbi:MAG TPA: DUF2891 family protein [Casimicrobiaceae bacterium]|nr:DUF2891 family protein [Casimicrobiaceae bacterium]